MSRPNPDRLVVDDFRGELRWKPVSWANANDCQLSLNGDKDARLSVDCREGKEEKAAIELRFPRALDITAFDFVCVEARVGESGGEKEIDLAVGFQTRGYFESPRRPLVEPGPSTIKIRLDRTDFKTSPGWEYDSVLTGTDRMAGLYLLIYYQDRCRVEIEKVWFGRQSAEKAPSAEPESSLPDTETEGSD
jgi:hypothetical protein